jgi:hypothetical protein
MGIAKTLKVTRTVCKSFPQKKERKKEKEGEKGQHHQSEKKRKKLVSLSEPLLPVGVAIS